MSPLRSIRGAMSIRQRVLTWVINRSPFTMDLAKMMVAANIPLSKVENPGFRKFLEVYCKQSVTERNTLTKAMEEEAKEQLQKIKAKLSGNDLCIQVDMTQLTIKANFQVVVHTITSLEERLPLVQSMQLVENLVEKVKQA